MSPGIDKSPPEDELAHWLRTMLSGVIGGKQRTLVQSGNCQVTSHVDIAFRCLGFSHLA